MSDAIERHEEEGARAFDKTLTRRLFRYLRPYRVRGGMSVGLVILSSILELAGPVWGRERAAALYERVTTLERVPDVAGLGGDAGL